MRESVKRYRTPHAKLKYIFSYLWMDIVSSDHCFANTLIEALSSQAVGSRKQSNLLMLVEGTMSDLLHELLPETVWSSERIHMLARLSWMAFDGFAINRRFEGEKDISPLVEWVVDMLLRADKG